ncbi:hypothetical protein [Flavobacterium sp. PL002]|uniref:hypothetical protein n=1 Tax=Flavobacterium sp. PL002 TaxID=1897058 RepID=UPI001787B026|nr:hypothetical protein [Flavobacterium sp. PL002]MBE0390307.1 hypothetical protein [Flavobacterium sp. PL002]
MTPQLKTTFSIIILLLTILSCNNSKQKTEIKTQSIIKDTLIIKPKNSVNNTENDLLVSTDLNIISSLNKNQKTDFYENGEQLTKFLSLELIDKTLFDSKKNTAVNFLLTDTTEVKKVNGVIELNCKNKVVKFIDKPEDNDGMQLFNYEGQIEFLNKYLIIGSYYEGGDYIFVDKTSGETTTTFGDYPNISPDKKNIICINSNGYETTADLELYKISNNKVNNVMNVSFKKWMPLMENNEVFWSKDGYLYLSVHNVKTFWNEKGFYNNKYQYIRIKIL